MKNNRPQESSTREPEGSLLCSQNPVTGFYSQPDEYSLNAHSFKTHPIRCKALQKYNMRMDRHEPHITNAYKLIFVRRWAPSVRRFSRKCTNLEGSKPYGPLWHVTRIALLFYRNEQIKIEAKESENLQTKWNKLALLWLKCGRLQRQNYIFAGRECVRWPFAKEENMHSASGTASK
jgi:hypothetical protein